MICEKYCLRLTCCTVNKYGFHIDNVGDLLINSEYANVKMDIKMFVLNLIKH